MEYTLTVTMSEDSDGGIADSFVGSGIELDFDSEEYHDDGTSTGTYNVECNESDLPTIRRKMEARSDVLDYLVS